MVMIHGVKKLEIWICDGVVFAASYFTRIPESGKPQQHAHKQLQPMVLAVQFVRQDQTLDAMKHPAVSRWYCHLAPATCCHKWAAFQTTRGFVQVIEGAEGSAGQVLDAEVASGDRAASGSKVSPAYIYRHPLLLRYTEDKFIHHTDSARF
jgi:hypothetical protein